MATTRIKDLTTASAMANDDYIAIDGATNGTRKIAASDVGGGGETMYEKQFATYYNNSFSSVGLYYIYYITPTNTSDATQENAMKIEAFYRAETSGHDVYPLIVTRCSASSTRMTVYVKSIHSLDYSTTTAQYLPAGYVYFRAPFEIASIAAGM